MPELQSFDEALRSEYDGQLLDTDQRKRQARRLIYALKAAGLWHPHGRILDVGCGAGTKLDFWGDHARLLVGSDLRRDLYLKVRDAIQSILFVQADGSVLPFFDQCFDVVTCISVIEEFPDYRMAVAEMARCLSPGGVLCINITNGKMLLPIYSIAGSLGKKIPESWRAYTRNGACILKDHPEDGFFMAELKGWRFVHLTPHIIQYELPFLKFVPLPFVDILSRLVSPTFVFAWIKPMNLEGAP